MSEFYLPICFSDQNSLNIFNAISFFSWRIPEEVWQFFKNSWDLVVRNPIRKAHGFSKIFQHWIKKPKSNKDLLRIHLENLELYKLTQDWIWLHNYIFETGHVIFFGLIYVSLYNLPKYIPGYYVHTSFKQKFFFNIY